MDSLIKDLDRIIGSTQGSNASVPLALMLVADLAKAMKQMAAIIAKDAKP